jgi:uncharacterized protein (DUF885 family)
MRIRPLALAGLLFLTGAAGGARAAPGTALGTLLEGYRLESAALDPLAATLAGEHRYDDELPNTLALGALARGLELERRALRASAALDLGALGPEERLTAEVFRRDRELAIEGYRYQEELLPFDADGGLPLTLARLGSGAGAQPFATVADHERWLRRLGGLSPWVDQAITNLRRGAAKGISLPRETVERLAAALGALVTDDPTASVYYRPAAALPSSVPAARAAALRNAYARAIREQVTPAYRRLATFLRDEYLPEARRGIAMSELPLGRGWYEHRLRRSTTTTLEPAALHALGQKEVARLEGELERTLAAAGQGDRRAYLAALAADPRNVAASGAELIAAYQELATRVAARLPEFVDGAAPPVAIRALAALPAGLVDGAPDAAPGLATASFPVDVGDLGASPRYLLAFRYLGRVVPGARYARAVAAGSALAPLRRAARYLACDEGWALYAAERGRELLPAETASTVAALAAALDAAAALVVDTGVHARGWSRAAALEYLGQHASGEAAGRAILARIIASPGEAGAATVGSVRIRELRERAERELGPRFEPAAFHHALLDGGSLPLDALERRVAGWLAARRAAP